MAPNIRPQNPNFSSGPCTKRPGWSLDALNDALLGRSHRSKPGKAKLAEVIEKTKAVLGIPSDYVVGIVPGSDTGAFEMAMWSMLGERGVDVLAWESFSNDWKVDIEQHMKLEDARYFTADYGQLPNLNEVDTDRDVIFPWNGTTSGVKVPNHDWIKADRQGLTFCDATSAVFSMELPWEKLDVTTWSWQKVMGGEAAHGMLVLSPRAVKRLESYTPAWPLPKLFRLTKKGKLNEGIFRGETINTPSMICVEDALDSLNWMESIGGLKACVARSNESLIALTEWVNATPWVDFLAEDANFRSNTSVCLKVVDPAVAALPEDDQAALVKQMVSVLDKEGIAYDINAYRTAPAGLRIWCGATVEPSDVKALLPWLDWAFEQATSDVAKAA